MKFPDLKTDEKAAKDSGTADFETAIVLTRFGKFHIFLIFVGGFCFLSTGFEYGLHAYILPFAQCDLRITAAQMGIINAMFLGGGITCSFFWGVMADTIGRRKVLLFSMICDGLATILASWSPSYIMFAIIRFVSGFMCGAPGCLVNSYVGEFCANKHRSRSICLVGFCWTIAWMLLPGIAWLVIPRSIHIQTPLVEYQSWRLFVAIIGLPNLISATLMYFLPESPKFLFIQGKEAEAVEVLKTMFHRNTGRPKEEYPVVNLVTTYAGKAKSESAIAVEEKGGRKGKSFVEVCGMMIQQMKQILSPPHLSRTILSSSIYFANFFGYYGLGLWLPELFNRFEAFYAQNPNGSISVCELSRMSNFSNSSVLDGEMALEQILSDCGERTINLGVFSNTFIMAAVCAVGNILAIVLSNKVGGRILSVAGTVMSGVCALGVYFSRSDTLIIVVNCLFMMGVGTAMITISTTNMIVAGCCGCYIYFVNSSIQNVIVSAVFVAAVNSALNVLNYCVVNLFPTYIRGMGVCIGILFGRAGAVSSNLIFGLLLDLSCEIPIFLMAGVVIFGGLLCLLLPKNSSQATE